MQLPCVESASERYTLHSLWPLLLQFCHNDFDCSGSEWTPPPVHLLLHGAVRGGDQSGPGTVDRRDGGARKSSRVGCKQVQAGRSEASALAQPPPRVGYHTG